MSSFGGLAVRERLLQRLTGRGFSVSWTSRKRSPYMAAAAAAQARLRFANALSGSVREALHHECPGARRTKMPRVKSNATRLPATTSNSPTTANADRR
jgi:hypothetical protein